VTRRPSQGRFGVGAALLVAVLPGLAGAAPPDSRDLDELAKDIARYADAVKDYRKSATAIIKRSYLEQQKEIKAKYEGQITQSEKEEKERRKDAIAMFEAFLRRYPHDKRWTPDAMFRLAELYYEKSSEEFLTAQEAYQKSLDSPNPPADPPPRVDYTPTVDLYKRLLTEFPNYRLLDASYYLLGFCLGEMQKDAEAKQVLLALVCSNKYRALDPPAPPPPPPTSGARGVLDDHYKDCAPARKDSKFLAEAWTRIGEMHFDAANELSMAIAAYSRVLEYKDSSYYDKALYKLAWSYYRDNRFKDAVAQFDNLIKWADSRKGTGDKAGSDLRPEAIQYLGISFSEPDWDGDTLPDAESGLQRAEGFYRGREEEPHVREVFQRLGDIYFDSTRYAEAIAVYKSLLAKWPAYSDAPRVQEKIVRAFERDRNLIQAAREREALGRNYSKNTDWYKKNRDNPDAIAIAQQLAEDALLIAATNVHSGAQGCKTKWQANTADIAKLNECKAMYRTAAELYEKYLAAYPNSKKAYEFSYFYAETLFYSDQLEAAVSAYATVRDSILDNKYQEDAAFQIIKSYEGVIERMKAERKLDDPPIPDEKNTKPPVVPIAMPDVYQRYAEAIDWYVANIKSDKTPELKYFTAVLALRYRNWPEARKRLGEVTDLYCKDKPEVGFKAYDAILQTYFIDYNVADEEQKDCALGKLLEVAEQFGESPCGRSDKAAPFLTRFNQIKADVKTSVITKRLQLSMENEEKGTSKELTVCREATGGIAMVTGTGGARTPGAPGQAAAKPGGKISTELDVGLALDLLDIVNANPKDENAPTALNNACVIYEKLFQFGEATKCYERLYRDYPSHRLASDALWNASRNHFRFFEFDQAVQGYLTIAEDPKFKGYEHRKEARGLAASLLDSDQQYIKAADLYKKYSEDIADKPEDSAQAYFYACTAYEKAKDRARTTGCLKDFIKRFTKEPAAGKYIVESYQKMAVMSEQGQSRRDTVDAYRRVRDEFIARKLPAATPAAGFAAKADFLIVEEKFKAFQGKQLKFGKPDQTKKVFDSFLAEAKALKDEYRKVWDYKDATWTLAAFLRSGDIFYEFAQKLIKEADNPPDEVKKLDKKICREIPEDCGMALTQYKDAIFQFVAPMEDEAKKQWKDTLARAAELGVTNDYVKKARENLSKYLPDEFPYVKDERIQMELP